jgi:carboxymethylenebutenolidase
MPDIALARQTQSAVWQEHMHAEFVLKDADAALATMVEEPYVLCVPSGTGGMGRAEVRDFYARKFLPGIPPDLERLPEGQGLPRAHPLGPGRRSLPAWHA